MNVRVNFIANQQKKILLMNKKKIYFTKKFFKNAEVDILQKTNIK